MFIHTIMKSNYDKTPSTHVDGRVICGWEAIAQELGSQAGSPVALDMYTGVYEQSVVDALRPSFEKIILTRALMKEVIDALK